MTWFGIPSNSGELLHSTNDVSFFNFSPIDGDVVGTYGDTTVSGIAGFAVRQVTPTTNDVLTYNGSTWGPAAPGGGSHELLSATHTDTVANTVTRGSLIYGNATPAWDELVLGTTGFVLYSDGTDVAYTQLGSVTPFSLGTSAAPSMTFTGDTDTGWAAESADIMTGSAGGSELLTLDGTATSITLDAGQIVRAEDVEGAVTLDSTDYIAMIGTAPQTVTLPAAPVSGQVLIIKDKNGTATNSDRITIAGNGNNIDGNSSIEIRNSYGSFSLLFNGSAWNVI